MQRQKPNTWVQLFMTRSLYIWLSCILIWGVQDQLIFPNIFSVVGCGGLWVFLPQSKWSDIFHRKEPHKQLRQKENKAASEDCKYRDWYQTKTIQWSLSLSTPVTSWKESWNISHLNSLMKYDGKRWRTSRYSHSLKPCRPWQIFLNNNT